MGLCSSRPRSASPDPRGCRSSPPCHPHPALFPVTPTCPGPGAAVRGAGRPELSGHRAPRVRRHLGRPQRSERPGASSGRRPAFRPPRRVRGNRARTHVRPVFQRWRRGLRKERRAGCPAPRRGHAPPRPFAKGRAHPSGYVATERSRRSDRQSFIPKRNRRKQGKVGLRGDGVARSTSGHGFLCSWACGHKTDVMIHNIKN